MFFDREHFHFFRNREIDALYIILALSNLAQGLISIFVPIYFWELGFEIHRILYFYFIDALYFVSFLLLLLPLIKRLTDKKMIILSIPFSVIYYLGLNYIDSYPILFYILPLFLTLNRIFFNSGYHINFSSVFDKKYVGREVGFRNMVGQLVQFSAPFIGGTLISLFGFKFTFNVGVLILFLMIIPLLFFPERKIVGELSTKSLFIILKDKKILPYSLSSIGYASVTMVGRIIWPLFIFINIENIRNFGGIISLGLLAGLITTYLVGYLSDSGFREKLLSLTAIISSVIWLSRTFITGILLISGNHILGNIVNNGLMVSWSSQFYDISRKTKSKSLFIISQDFLYNFSRIFFLPLLMLISYLMKIEQFFSISFVIAALVTLMYFNANKIKY